MHIFSSPYAKATPEIVCLVFFDWSQSESLSKPPPLPMAVPRLCLPVEPPQARASARVLAKHVCQPKSCGCVVNVCCNWEIYIKILLGWCGGAKEGLRNVNLGCGIQLNATRHSFDGKDVFTIVHAQRFVSEEALGGWGCQVSLFVVISRRVGISPHPVAENHMFWAVIVKWAVATFLCIGSDI